MAEPQAIRAARSFQTRLQSANAETILAMTRRWQAVEASLQEEIETLADEVAQMEPPVPAWKIYELERYQSLLAQIQREVNNYMQWAIVRLGDEANAAQQQARRDAAQMLRLLAGPGADTLTTALDRLGTEAAEKITGLAQGGNPLEAVLNKMNPLAIASLTNELVAGAAVGRNPRETARRMMRDGLATGLNHALLVARDQQIRNYREAQRDAYMGSSVVYGYIRVAARNDRTCMACIALDGTIYETSQVMQLHPQDRCAMIPLVVGRPVPQIESAREWFRRQPESVQRRMMGPGRFELWKARKVQLRQFVSVKPNRVWGPSSQVTSLRDLRQGGGGVGGAQLTAGQLRQSFTATPPAEPQRRVLDGGGLEEQDLRQMLGTAGLSATPLLTALANDAEPLLFAGRDGGMEGYLAYTAGTKHLNIKAAGFVGEEENLAGLLDLAEIAQQQGVGLKLFVPHDLVGRYAAWGFEPEPDQAAEGLYMSLGADSLAVFKADPAGYGEQVLAQAGAKAAASLASESTAVVFQRGYKLPGTPFEESGPLTEAEITGYKAQLPELPELVAPPGKHVAAGMLLFDTASQSFVTVRPAGGFGPQSFPKGTAEEGEDLQETAIREVWEETGLKAQIVGWLGDYEKSTSMNRMFVGVIDTGAPWQAGSETQSVNFMGMELTALAESLLANAGDKKMLQDFMSLMEKGGGDFAQLETAVKSWEQDKLAALAALQQAQLDAFAKWAADGRLSEADYRLAIEGAKLIEPDTAGVVREDYRAWKEARAETKQQASASRAQSAGVWRGYFNGGIDALETVRTDALRAAIAYGYANGYPSGDLVYLEAVLNTRLETQANQPIPVPGDLNLWTKKQMVAELAKVTGADPWKLKQLTAPQVKALFGKTPADILAEAELAGAEYYTADKPQAEQQQREAARAADTLVLKPLELVGANKPALVKYLAEQTGATPWKLNEIPKAELEQLFGKTPAEIYEAAEAAAQAAYQKKQGKKAALQNAPAKKLETEVLTPDLLEGDPLTLARWLGVSPKAATYVTNIVKGGLPAQVGAVKNVLLGQDAATAAQLITDNYVGSLAAQYYAAWYNGGALQSVAGKEEGALVAQYLVDVGHSDQKLVAEMQQLFLRPATTPQPETTTQPTPAPSPPPPPPKPAGQPAEKLKSPTGTVNVTGASAALVADIQAKGQKAFGGDAIKAKGVAQALGNIQNGAKGLVYLDEAGNLKGIAALVNDGQYLKMSGAAFADTATNMTAVADALTLADELGLGLKTWVPDSVTTQYQSWGFTHAESKYYVVSPDTVAPDVAAAASSTITAQTDKIVTLPPGVETVADAGKLKKTELVNHLAEQLPAVSKAGLNKLSKPQLLTLFGEGTAGEKARDMIAAVEAKQANKTLLSAWQDGKRIQSSKQAFQLLDYVSKTKPAGVTLADMAGLRTLAEQLAEEERLRSPYRPGYELRPPPVGLPDQPRQEKPKTFPPDPNKLRVVSRLGGTTGAELVEDPTTGRRYVRKRGARPEQARTEVAADNVYAALGLRVPRAYLYETAAGPVKLAEFVPGRSLADFLATAKPREREKVLDQVRAGFAADALLGNWDVMGQERDNILVDDNGQVWRVDNGGSLSFRAMGDRKEGNDWNIYPTDLWTMREPGRPGAGRWNAEVFGSLDWYDITEQMRQVVSRGEDILAALPPEERRNVWLRIENYRDIVDTSDEFKGEGYRPEFADGVARASTYMGQDGVLDRLPKKLKQRNRSDVTVLDEQGREFDTLRGYEGLSGQLERFVRSQGGDFRWITSWMQAQAGTSWSERSQAFKYWIASQRGGAFDDYYWEEGTRPAKRYFERYTKEYGRETFDKTMYAYKAFVHQVLRRVEFPRNYRDQGFVEICRTEERDVINIYNLRKTYAEAQRMKRGAAESGSVYGVVTVKGDQVTLQRVPYSRIWGVYFMSKGENGSTPFYGDSENEFIFDGRDLDVWYVGTATSRDTGYFWDQWYKENGQP